MAKKRKSKLKPKKGNKRSSRTPKRSKVKSSVRTLEENQLFVRFKKGSLIARDKLLKKYSPWVINIAKKYHNCFPRIDLSELVAEGNQGLLEALYHYDTTSAAKVSTYAWFWIVKNIQAYISNTLGLIGIPRRVIGELKQITYSINNEIKKGKVPSLEKISKKLDMDLDAVREMLSDKKNLSQPLSLDRFIDEDEHSQTLWDMIEDKSQENMLDVLAKSDGKININDFLGRLSPIEAEIIRLRYGFKGNGFHALKEIGEKLKISASKVKDIESVAIIKLKRFIADIDSLDTETTSEH
jgi:RNA polymerase primary sigma factor